ncbi:flippase [Candidatus Woesearchaeota archaeon]|nr:flippase [Candidatus Woesearchaeota archaeon]
MNGVKNIAINTASLIISEVITKIVQFLIFVFIARSLGSVVFGKFNFAYSFSMIAVLLMDLGINYMLVRNMAKNKKLAGDYIINSFAIKIILSAISFAAIYFIFSMSNYPEDTRMIVYILVLFAFLRSFTELVFSVFKAYEAMHYEAFLKILRMIATLIFGLAALKIRKDIVLLAIIFLLVEGAVFIISLVIALSKFLKLKLSLSFGFSREILKEAFPFSLSFVFASVYFYIGSVMLSAMKGDSAVGIYSAAYNLTLAILFIPGMYTFAIYPVISKNFGKFRDRVVLIYEKSFKYMYIIGLPISIGFFMLAEKIILFFYGREFAESVLVLKLVSWFVFIKFISFITGIILSVQIQRLRAFAQGVTAVLNLALNFLLIPKYSYIGAAVATLISETALFALTLMFVSKYFHVFDILKLLHKPLLASAIMAAFIIYLNINLFAVMAVGAIVYFAALFLLKTFDERDYSLMKSLVKIDNGQEY